MEGSEEALRNSAETRQVLKRTAAAVVQEPPAKKPAIDKRAACTHVVALPDNWEPPAEALDSAVYGVLHGRSLCVCRQCRTGTGAAQAP